MSYALRSKSHFDVKLELPVLLMRKELQSCVGQLKDWRNRVQTAEARVAELENKNEVQYSKTSLTDGGSENTQVLERDRAKAEWRLVNAERKQQTLSAALQVAEKRAKELLGQNETLSQEKDTLSMEIELIKKNLQVAETTSGTLSLVIPAGFIY